jgi:hypothetical protein
VTLDDRIAAVERQVIVLSGQVAARDAAITTLLKEATHLQLDTARKFYDQYPQMLAEIDHRVQTSFLQADDPKDTP